MVKETRQRVRKRRAWVKEYGIGLGLGPMCALYGLIALLGGRTFLPGLRGGKMTVTGPNGLGLAAAYVAGGLFLICRFFVHRRCRTRFARGQIYLLENLLLIVVIAALVYVLLKVGTVA